MITGKVLSCLAFILTLVSPLNSDDLLLHMVMHSRSNQFLCDAPYHRITWQDTLLRYYTD